MGIDYEYDWTTKQVAKDVGLKEYVVLDIVHLLRIFPQRQGNHQNRFVYCDNDVKKIRLYIALKKKFEEDVDNLKMS